MKFLKWFSLTVMLGMFALPFSPAQASLQDENTLELSWRDDPGKMLWAHLSGQAMSSLAYAPLTFAFCQEWTYPLSRAGKLTSLVGSFGLWAFGQGFRAKMDADYVLALTGQEQPTSAQIFQAAFMRREYIPCYLSQAIDLSWFLFHAARHTFSPDLSNAIDSAFTLATVSSKLWDFKLILDLQTRLIEEAEAREAKASLQK